MPIEISQYTIWAGYGTVAALIITIASFIFKWGFRFRLVGVTSFMGVVTVSLFALGLGLFVRPEIPGATRYTLVFDNAADRAVITVPPDVDKKALEPTLRQAANDLYSYGRTGLQGNQMTIRMRTVLHPKPGVSVPLYLGEVNRTLASREDKQMEIKLFSKNISQLPKNSPKSKA